MAKTRLTWDDLKPWPEQDWDEPKEVPVLRTFDSGATRDTEEGKPDYCGFLSPDAIVAYGEYMHKHRYQSDGTLRAADNWKKGIPRDEYLKSMFRHFITLWQQHEIEKAGGILENGSMDYNEDEDMIEEALCALLFNVQGYLDAYLKGR
jgi:hypothetical protein